MGDVSLNPQPLINDEPLTLPATAAKVIDQAFFALLTKQHYFDA
jgi:hypothetical protein